MKRSRILGLVFIFSICSVAFLSAADETLTITTYYPSPYGVYKTLRLYPNDTIDPTAASCPNRGEMYFDDSDGKLYVCSGASGSATWQSAGGGGYWTKNGNNIYNNNTGTVGIGIDPAAYGGYKLAVNGASYLNGALTVNGSLQVNSSINTGGNVAIPDASVYKVGSDTGYTGWVQFGPSLCDGSQWYAYYGSFHGGILTSAVNKYLGVSCAASGGGE